jgi:hypothetical protein
MRLFVIFVAVVGLALTVEAGIFKAAEYNSCTSRLKRQFGGSFFDQQERRVRTYTFNWFDAISTAMTLTVTH